MLIYKNLNQKEDFREYYIKTIGKLKMKISILPYKSFLLIIQKRIFICLRHRKSVIQNKLLSLVIHFPENLI